LPVNPALTIYQNSVEDFIHIDFTIDKLDDTCAFSEGPVWHSEGYYLFSDIPKNNIAQLTPGKEKKVFLRESGFTGERETELSEQIGSNGLAFDGGGSLLICQHGNGAIAKYDGASIKPFLTQYEGRRFNSPNDIIAHQNGSLFFSDPPYGLKDGKAQPQKFQPIAAFYCWRNGEIQLLTDKYQYPNGVCLSPDEKSLYTCSNKPFEKFILEFDTETLACKRTICAENSDGIKCDRRGNLYLCSKEGILIINPAGERLAKIELETIPANACWGGKDLTDLFITARENIFLIPNLQKD
jgi:gluconolactonase